MRLTKEMKNSIRIHAMKGRFDKEYASIEIRRVALGDELYNHTYGAVEEIVRSLPPVWREMGTSIYVECEDYDSYDSASGKVALGYYEYLDEKLPLSHERPLPFGRSWGGTAEAVEVKSDHPLWPKFRQLVKDYTKIRQKEADLRSKINAVLASCNTDKQLLDTWPEAAKFLPKPSHSVALVPITLVSEINAMLGLQPENKGAAAAVRKAASTN